MITGKRINIMNNSNISNKDVKYAKQAKMDSPYNADSRNVYHFFVNARDIPAGLPTDVNPRKVNEKKKVFKKIVAGLCSDEESFFLNNRGILISAKKVSVDPLNKVVHLDVGNGSDNDNSVYGVLDGGHTYRAIIEHAKDIPEDVTQYVHLEIMENVKNSIDELASARNTSVQVSDKAIAELAHKFGFVKDAISNEEYANNVSYKENEDDKSLDSIDLVRLMFAFNIFKYNENTTAQPTSAYSGKAQVLKDYLKSYDTEDNPYRKIAKLLPDITRLYDAVERDTAESYLEKNVGGRFGKVKGVESKKAKTKFYNYNIDYQISQGLILPIVAAFRALIKIETDGSLVWEIEPLKIWSEIRTKLVNNTIEMSRSLGNNPQSAGKNASLWSQNFDAVNNQKLQVLIKNLRN